MVTRCDGIKQLGSPVDPAGAGAGEANTASNAGVTGVGITLPKSGVDFPFKSHTAASSKMSIVNNVGNNSLDHDVVEPNLNLGNMGGSITLAQVSDSAALAALNTVGTPQIDNGAATFAKIQDIAASTLVGRGSAGGTGSLEQIILDASLIMTGTTLSAAAAGGGLPPLLQEVIANNNTFIDLENNYGGALKSYIIHVINVTGSVNDANLRKRVGIGATPTYPEGATDYSYTQFRHTSSSSVNNGIDASQMHITTGTNAIGNATTENISGFIFIHNPADTTFSTNISWDFPAFAANARATSFSGAALYKPATAVTASRFFMDNGLIATGTFRVHGWI